MNKPDSTERSAGKPLVFETVDYHTAGEPLRVVTAGLPALEGGTMLEKRRTMQRDFDYCRRLLMLEPRGHADMYGAILTEAVTGDGDTGVLFMHNQGYSTMCGHGIIALACAAVEQDLFGYADREEIRFDTPAGRIVAAVTVDQSGRPQKARFRNVPSFVLEPEYSVLVDGQTIDMTIAFGGAFYAYVDAGQCGLELVPAELHRMIRLGKLIRERVNAHYRVEHPSGDPDMNFLYGTIFSQAMGAGHDEGRSSENADFRNVCLFADGEVDRSPTGTGASGRLAIEWSHGNLAVGESLVIESILGTRFEVRCAATCTVGGLRAVVPEVSGSASHTGSHRFVLEPDDLLPNGFLLR